MTNMAIGMIAIRPTVAITVIVLLERGIVQNIKKPVKSFSEFCFPAVNR